MTSQPISEPPLGLVPRMIPQPGEFSQDEFMDKSGRFFFRDYINDISLVDRAQALIKECLTQIVKTEGTLSNSQLYDSLHAALCGPEPLESEPLLRFMRYCAKAIRDEIQRRAEMAQCGSFAAQKSLPATFAIGSPTSLYLAEQFPSSTLKRLSEWSEFYKAHQASAEVYELSDFVGCTDEEIAQLLPMTSKRVKDLRVFAFSIICKHDPQ